MLSRQYTTEAFDSMASCDRDTFV